MSDDLVPSARLTAYLDRWGFGTGPLAVAPLGDGHSNPTFSLTRAGFSAVLRRPPRPPYPAGAHDVLREAEFLRALEGTTVPAPAILAVCTDPAVLGVPFYLSEFIEGFVFSRQAPAELPVACHRQIGEELIDALLAIHEVPWAERGLGGAGRGAGYLERQLRRFSTLLDAYRSRPTPDLDHLTRWLGRHVPQSPPPTLVHGDYRLGNVMYGHPGDPRLVAVLDWELATIGDRFADLGYAMAMWAQPEDPPGLHKLAGASAAPSFPSREALLERYCARSGLLAPEITWYVTLAWWKFCVIMEGNYRRTLDGVSRDGFARAFAEDVLEIAAHARRLAQRSPRPSLR